MRLKYTTEVDCGEQITLWDFIGGDKLTIKTWTRGGTGFSFEFGDEEFCIACHEGQVSFSRLVFRPTHDHNDIEYLQPDLTWTREWRTALKIPFGSVTE